MGNYPSIPGLGGARPHVRRDHGYVDSDRKWRPEQSQTRDSDVEDIEEVDRVEDKVNIPEIYVGHNGAQGRGAMMSSDVAPTDEVARHMGRQAIEVNTVANAGHSRSDATVCDDVTSSVNAVYSQHRPSEKSDNSLIESGGCRSPEELGG